MERKLPIICVVMSIAVVVIVAVLVAHSVAGDSPQFASLAGNGEIISNALRAGVLAETPMSGFPWLFLSMTIALGAIALTYIVWRRLQGRKPRGPADDLGLEVEEPDEGKKGWNWLKDGRDTLRRIFRRRVDEEIVHY